MIIPPSGEGPQKWGTGGEVEIWSTKDEGRNWTLIKSVTQGSEYNHMYVRQPVRARDPFFVFWVDGDTKRVSSSRFYFSNRDGSRVWRLPYTMTEDWVAPEEMSFDQQKFFFENNFKMCYFLKVT